MELELVEKKAEQEKFINLFWERLKAEKEADAQRRQAENEADEQLSSKIDNLV